MDPIKEAFQRIKEDIEDLRQEIFNIKNQLNDPNQQPIQQSSEKPQQYTQNIQQTPHSDQTMPVQTPTQTPSQTDTPTHNPTIQHIVQPLKQPNMAFSIGNEGVPTDKPTDRQTNQQTDKTHSIDDFERANEILANLDSIKKGIRLKFKRLTTQEMLVFSTLYGLEEQNIEEITYKLIANNLNLSESSIRDYVNKLINKGIPLIKVRQNNKKITLRVSPDLQNIASLSTIIKLREL
jgi:hypothetical protein